jgi:hypothetical protein
LAKDSIFAKFRACSGFGLLDEKYTTKHFFGQKMENDFW